jgi:TolB protein
MKVIISLFFLIFSVSSFSQDAIIAIGEAGIDKDKFVIDDPEMLSLNGSQKALSLELIDILRNNFIFYKHKFNLVDYSGKGQNSFSNPQLEKWKATGVTYFIASQFSASGGGVESQFKVWSILSGKEIFSQKIKVMPNNLRPSAHQVADSIYRSITGRPSIFLSKIVFVSDRGTSGKDATKDLYLMDFDGNRVERLTNFNSVVISPAVAADNSKIMFSLISPRKEISQKKVRIIQNIDLKVYDLQTKKISTLSDRPGINSGAIFSAKNNLIYLTLSFTGNADIYEMNTDTKQMRKISSHYGDDVDPSINREGTLMTFLSNRSGRAHIYTCDPSNTEKDIKRISFVGQFNATPRFSPEGREIVFSSWVDNKFDLYRIGADGNNLVRLTKDFGSNEEPVYSPDGEFIVFTSKKIISRKLAVKDLYIMNREGEILGQLTKDFGQCSSPQWTNILK